MDYIHYYQSPLGRIILASDGLFLVGLWFDRQKYYADDLSKETKEKNLPIFDTASRWLAIYFAGECQILCLRFLCEVLNFARQYGKYYLPYHMVKR